MPQITVIVPVYKVEQYLPRCIESILAQTFTDFELILVDDGSPDNCGKICDEYASKDSRVRVIHQENKGVSAARNLGIAEAEGKNVAFVDSDDAIHPQMFELLSFVLEHTDYPFVHCAFHRLYDGELEMPPQKYKCELSQIQELTSEQGMLKMMDWKTYGHYIWKGLYRKAYIQSISFPLNIRWEDVLWSGEIVGKAKRFAYVPFDLYTYNMIDTSLTHRLSWEVQRQFFSALQEYMELARQLTPSVANEVELEVFQAFLSRENTMYINKTLDSIARDAIEKAAKSCHLTVSKVMRSDMNFRRKSVFLVSLLSFPLGCRIRRMLIR